MNTFIMVISYIAVASLMFLGGYVTAVIFQRTKSYFGVIKVIREDDRVLYSLEIPGDPSDLEHESEVTFKVEASNKNPDRK